MYHPRYPIASFSCSDTIGSIAGTGREPYNLIPKTASVKIYDEKSYQNTLANYTKALDSLCQGVTGLRVGKNELLWHDLLMG